MKKNYLSRAAIVALSMGLASNMMAEDVNVNDVATLKAAVANAQNGDVINLAAGTYLLDGEIDITGKDISLIGQGNVVLDGQNTVRVMNVHANANATVENLIIQNGYVNNPSNNKGAGIRVDGGSLTVTNCKFVNNNVDGQEYNWTGGAGIHSNNAKLTVSHSEFNGNSAYQGGAIILQNTNAEISNTLFEGNRTCGIGGSGKKDASKGGAICVRTDDGTVHTHNFEYCVFKENVSWGNGGAVSYNVSGGAAGQNTTFRGCSFVRNTTNLDIKNLAVTDNNNGLRGGAVFIDTDGKMKVYFLSCTITQNYAATGAGGVALATFKTKPEAEAHFVNCTITDNHNLNNSVNAAGLWINDNEGCGGIHIVNTILTGNWSKKVQSEGYADDPTSQWEYSDLITGNNTNCGLISISNSVIGYLNNSDKYTGDYDNASILRDNFTWITGETEADQRGELAAYDETYFAYPFKASAENWLGGSLGDKSLAAEYNCTTDQFGKEWKVNCIGAVQYADLKGNVDVPVFFTEYNPGSGIVDVKTTAKSADDAYYTLNGVRVTTPAAKGLYIHNGKKIVKR